MKPKLSLLAIIMVFGSASTLVDAKGCVKDALAGGVAGQVAAAACGRRRMWPVAHLRRPPNDPRYYGDRVVTGTGGNEESFSNIRAPLELLRAVQSATDERTRRAAAMYVLRPEGISLRVTCAIALHTD